MNNKNSSSHEQQLSSSVSSTSSSSSSSSVGSKHSPPNLNANPFSKTKSNRIKNNKTTKRKIKNEHNSALVSLQALNQRGKIASKKYRSKNQHEPQTIININAGVHNFEMDAEPSHQNHHRFGIIKNNEENDTDIIDESDSDLELSLNKVSAGNSGLSDEENEEEELASLKYKNANILIKQQHFYQQQQQQHLRNQYNFYNNNQENEPIRSNSPSSQTRQPQATSRQIRHKGGKNGKAKSNRNTNANADSTRSLKLKSKVSQKEGKVSNSHTLASPNEEELNNSEDEYDQRSLRKSFGLNQNFNNNISNSSSDQHHVKNTGNLNESHESFITAETMEEVKTKNTPSLLRTSLV